MCMPSTSSLWADSKAWQWNTKSFYINQIQIWLKPKISTRWVISISVPILYNDVDINTVQRYYTLFLPKVKTQIFKINYKHNTWGITSCTYWLLRHRLLQMQQLVSMRMLENGDLVSVRILENGDLVRVRIHFKWRTRPCHVLLNLIDVQT